MSLPTCLKEFLEELPLEQAVDPEIFPWKWVPHHTFPWGPIETYAWTNI